MRKKIINSAVSRLSSARFAIRAFEDAKNVGEQKRAWWQFLTAASAVFEKLRAGAHESGGRSSAWYGRLKAARKADPLLSYVHHARDADYHGIEESSAAKPFTYGIHDARGNLMFGFVASEPSDDESISSPPNLKADLYVDNTEITPENAAQFGVGAPIQAARVYLVDVVDDRFGDRFPTPKSHLGEVIDGTNPLEVAKATVAYLEKVIVEARALEAD